MSSTSRTDLLRRNAHAFCEALISPPEPAVLLEQYFSSSPSITEHGPAWATKKLPFLGKTFIGTGACIQYFEYLSQTLRMHLTSTSFPRLEDFVVDIEGGAISVVGNGRFESVETGKWWDEEFVYRMTGWDGDGKLSNWEIWADPLSAWVAVTGDQEGVMGTNDSNNGTENTVRQTVGTQASGNLDVMGQTNEPNLTTEGDRI